jgi:hydroxymethylpyrimidine pyrophosphatase-like HAD family hydrolase
MILRFFSTSSSSPSPAVPPVLVSLDLDGSLIGPDVRKTVAMLNELHDKGVIEVLINTGNNPDYIQSSYYRGYLKGLKVDTLVLHNGQRIYENPEPETQTFDEFVIGIKDKPQEPVWFAYMQKIWDRQRVIRLIHQAVDDFAETCGIPKKAFHARNSTPRFSVKKDQISSPNLERFVQKLLALTKAAGTEAVVFEVEDSGDKYKFALAPKGVDKATAVEHKVLQKIEEKGERPYSGVVTLDDAPNGKAMLTTIAYGNGTVPNYPTLVGRDGEMRKALRDHPRVVFTQPQNVTRALREQIAAAQEGNTRVLAEA